MTQNDMEVMVDRMTDTERNNLIQYLFEDHCDSVGDAIFDDVHYFIDSMDRYQLGTLVDGLYSKHPHALMEVFTNYDIQEEFAERGLEEENVNLSDFSDSEIEDEFEARGLGTEDDNSLVLEIVHGINCGRDMSMAVTSLLEQLSGRLVCPQR